MSRLAPEESPQLPNSARPQPLAGRSAAEPPLAVFTLTLGEGGTELIDHADGSRHLFAHLLGAAAYMDLVLRDRRRLLTQGGLR